MRYEAMNFQRGILPFPSGNPRQGSGAYYRLARTSEFLRTLSLRHAKRETFVSLFAWRRERDSNPRKLSLQRFSRPPHSTALPSFHIEITENRQFYSVLRFPSFNRLISSAFQDRRVRPLCHLCKILYYFSRAARRCQLIFMHESCPKARGKNYIAFI